MKNRIHRERSDEYLSPLSILVLAEVFASVLPDVEPLLADACLSVLEDPRVVELEVVSVVFLKRDAIAVMKRFIQGNLLSSTACTLTLGRPWPWCASLSAVLITLPMMLTTTRTRRILALSCIGIGVILGIGISNI